MGERHSRTLKRAAGHTLGTCALAFTMLAVGLVGTGQAAQVGCGAVITASTTLASDVGPCAGDGLVVTAANIKLNLNGKRVFGANGAGDNAGIRLRMVSRVTVTGGTVEGFDAGVVIEGGSANTVRGVTVQNNINDFGAPPCELGDGIAIFDSSANTITGNRALHNGPFSGISVVGDADRNVIGDNIASDNNVVGTRCGNSRQDEGVRIEGPGANDNRVERNRVERNLLAGVGLHGFVCSGDPAEVDDPNTGTVVSRNVVNHTAGTPIAAGINFLEQGPAGVVCSAYGSTVDKNTSTDNESDGIFVAISSHDNLISRNDVNNNANAGIFLNDPAYQNVFTNLGPTLLDLVSPDRAPYVEGTDYAVLEGSGSGDVTAPLVAVGPITIPPAGFDTSASGCSPTDFVGFPAGAVALVQRGFCDRAQKVDNAVAAGASAVIMFNEGSPGRTGLLTAGVGAVSIPVIGTTYALGVDLYHLTQAGPVTIHVITHTTNERVVVAPAPYDNTLITNRGAGNGVVDGYDGNLEPPCDNNLWLANRFGTVNQPCVAGRGGFFGLLARARTAGGGRPEYASRDVGRKAAAGT